MEGAPVCADGTGAPLALLLQPLKHAATGSELHLALSLSALSSTVPLAGYVQQHSLSALSTAVPLAGCVEQPTSNDALCRAGCSASCSAPDCTYSIDPRRVCRSALCPRACSTRCSTRCSAAGCAPGSARCCTSLTPQLVRAAPNVGGVLAAPKVGGVLAAPKGGGVLAVARGPRLLLEASETSRGQPTAKAAPAVAVCQAALCASVLVRVGQAWGSGVVLNSELGVIASNAHVVLPAVQRCMQRGVHGGSASDCLRKHAGAAFPGVSVCPCGHPCHLNLQACVVCDMTELHGVRKPVTQLLRTVPCVFRYLQRKDTIKSAYTHFVRRFLVCAGALGASRDAAVF